MTHSIKLTDTTLRDGHQSLWATRMHTSDMIPIIEKLDAVGFHSLEVWGGATFDVCLRFLDEDPWERLRAIKKRARNTPLQMLLRGQSLVGYRHYPDDVVEAFIHRAVANGVDIIRIFDALNDVRNFETAIKAAAKAGAHVQAAVVYTVSPVHTTEHYLETAAALAEMGADSICIKDMAGLLEPYKAYELVRALKKKLGLPVQLHCHFVGGLAVGAYLKGAEGGADIVDAASAPLAFGSSQPPVETIVRSFKDTPFDTGLDLNTLFEIADYFEELRKEKGFERGVSRINDMRVFEHQVPGGMISNLISQLKEQKATDCINEVLKEIPRVRAELGYPPLVTPTSQIVGAQAVLNVLSGERYKLIPGEVRDYIRGLYGRPPAPVDDRVREKALRGEEIIQCRPADLLEPQMGKLKKELAGLTESEEDLLTYALFPQVTEKLLQRRASGKALNLNKKAAIIAGGSNQNSKFGKIGEVEEMNLHEIKELIKLVNHTDIFEVSLESDGIKVAIRKGKLELTEAAGAGIQVPVVQNRAIEEGAQPAPVETAAGYSAEKARYAPTGKKDEGVTNDSLPCEEKTCQNLYTVKSPVVGTFYRAPAPDADPFVEVGDRVKKGQVLCIVEAMKLMNEIEAGEAGIVREIMVENAESVEYGQALFVIEKE